MRCTTPRSPPGRGPDGVVAAVSVYQEGVEGHWGVSRTSSRPATGSSLRWTGSGTHVGEVNGIPPTGKNIRVDAISIHRMANGKIDETWEIWDHPGFLQQLGVMPG